MNCIWRMIPSTTCANRSTRMRFASNPIHPYPMPRLKPMRCFRRRGKKGEKHSDPTDPPRRRANQQKGHGTYENDRPPIIGTVGRDSGQVRLRMVKHTDSKTLKKHMAQCTLPDAVANTDEWNGYNQIERQPVTVNHGEHEWARDDSEAVLCMMVMASLRFTSIRRKGCGLGRGIFGAPFAACIRIICRVTLRWVNTVST